MICKFCGKEILNIVSFHCHIIKCDKNTDKLNLKQYFDKFVKKEFDGICITCKKLTEFISIREGYKKYCNVQCCNKDPKRIQNIKENNLKKYGSVAPMGNKGIQQKTKITNQKKYNCDHPMKNNNVKEKTKNTIKNRYGVDNVSQSDEIKKLKKIKSLNKYGTDYPFQSIEVKNKIKNVLVERYNVENLMYSDIFKNKMIMTRRNHVYQNFSSYDRFLNKVKPLFDVSEYDGATSKKYKFQCNKCNNIFYDRIDCGKIPRCLKCYPLNISFFEREFYDFLNSIYKKKIIQHDRTIVNPKELDIYLPDEKIAFELNGLYWHSHNRINDSNYHLNKTLNCNQKNVRLYHLFEDEWLNKKDIIQNKIISLLNLNNKQKIYARKCIIKEISNQDKDNFLEKYHIQGKDVSKIRLGAFFNDQLISVMTFNHGNITKGVKKFDENIWELNRFCSCFEFRVIGIGSKLLMYFKRNYKWNKIYTYADRRWSVGNLYKILGFNFVGFSSPNYWYIVDNKRVHRFNFQKKNLKEFKNYDDNLSEKEIMISNGFDIIYDCGNLKFEMTV